MSIRTSARALLLLLSLWLSLALVACHGKERRSPPRYGVLPVRDAALEQAPTAGRLPDDVHPSHYQLELAIDPQQPLYRGKVHITLALDRPRDTLWLHSSGPQVSRVQLVRHDGSVLDGRAEPATDNQLLAVRLPQAVGPGSVRLELEFQAPFGERLTGLYLARAEGEPYAFTQFEPTSAREAFPCLDEPRFKTPFDVRIVSPAQLTAIANTSLLESQPLAEGQVAHRFATTERLPTYLLAFAVGRFDVVSAPALPKSELRDREVPLRGVSVKGRGQDLATALRETPKLVSELERYFGSPYPYDKLDLIAVPDFGAGAMENAGAITFRDTLLLLRADASERQLRSLANVNAHELAHQWFGNLVTMPWWNDLWLNEAFATWMAARVVEAVYPEHQARLGELAYTEYAMQVDSQAAARQIRQPIESNHDIENAFDAITYAKGGAVLAMFERYLGQELFRAGLRLYMERHRFASASAEDLIAALSQASARPELSAAFRSFLEQPGVPLVEVQLRCEQDKAHVSLKQQRYAPLGVSFSRERLWQVPVCLRYAAGAQSREQCLLLQDAQLELPLTSPSCPQFVLPNAGAAGYYRYALDDAALDQLVGALTQLNEAEQMSLVHNLSAAFRAGRLSAERLVPALDRLGQLPSRYVLEQVLSVLSSLRDKLLDPRELTGYRALIARLVQPRFQKLGLYPKPGEQVSGDQKLLRASVTRALLSEARDPALQRELAALGRAQLGLSSHPKLAQLPPELIDSALTAALREGGEPVLLHAIEKLKSESDGTQRGRLLSAIASLDQPEHSARVLALTLDPKLRTNERLAPLFGQGARRPTREQALAFLVEQRGPLLELLGEHQRADVLGAIDDLCSEVKAREVEQLFGREAEHLPGGPRQLALTLESIRACSALEEAQGPALRAVFQAMATRAPVAPRGKTPRVAH